MAVQEGAGRARVSGALRRGRQRRSPVDVSVRGVSGPADHAGRSGGADGAVQAYREAFIAL